MIKRVHHVQITIPVGAEDAARKFYCDLLGLVEIRKPDSLLGRGGFWLELGNVQVHVGAEDIVGREASKAHVAYLVDDLQSWRDRLAERGVQTLDGIPIPDYERLETRDPFGNRIELLERRSG